MSGLVSKLAGMVTSIIKKAASGLTKVGSSTASRTKSIGTSVNTAKNVHSSTTPVSPTTGMSMIGTAGGAAWGLVYMLFFALVVWFLPILLEYLKKVFNGLEAASQRWIRTVHRNADQSYWWQTVFFVVFRLLPFTFSSIHTHAIKPLLKNALVILVTAAIVIVFTFSNRHFYEIIEGISDISDVFVVAVNVLGLAFQIVVECINLFLPITNFYEHTGMILIIKIYDAITYSIETFGSPQRSLSELGSEQFFVSLQPIILLWQTMSSAELYLQVTIIDIASRTGLIYAATYIVSYIAVGVAKVCCAIADLPCGIRELLDAIIYDIIIERVVNGFLGLFGASIEITHNIACSTGVLVSAHITSACYGSLFSWESGYYRNAPRTGTSGRRNTMACVSQGGQWHETINGDHVHSSPDPALSCPHIRAALTSPYGNAINLEKMDEHHCYTSCVRNINIETCSDSTTTYLGSCGPNTTTTLTHREASRRLKSMFGGAVVLKERRRVLAAKSVSRIDAIHQLTDKFQPLQFESAFGACDLTQPPTGPLDTFYDLMCLTTKFNSAIEANEGRGGGGGSGGGALMDVVNSLRHTSRKLNTHDPSISLDAPTNPFLLVKWAIHNATQGRRGPGNGRGRKLAGPCEPGELLCQNGFQCIPTDASMDDCMVPETLGPIGIVRYYLLMARNIIKSFSIKDSIYNQYTCWRYLVDNPEHDRYHSSNLLIRDEDIVPGEFTYCYPMIQPTPFVWEKWEWSLRDQFFLMCSTVSSKLEQCYCPMFYPLNGPTVQFGDYINSNIVNIILNGLIFFKNIFVLLVTGWVGYIWSSLLTEPTFSREVSNAFSLHSADLSPEVYWICSSFQIGSAATLILFVWAIYAGLRVAVDITGFVLSGGMTHDERMRAHEQRGLRRRVAGLERREGVRED